MKLWKKLIKWIVFSLLLQIIFLWFLDSFYLKYRGDVIEVARYTEKDIEGSHDSVKIPVRAQDIKVSFDTSMIGYIMDGNLYIKDIRKSKKDKDLMVTGKEIQYYRWLPDRNMVIYASKDEKSKRQDIRVETYEVDTGILRAYPEIGDIDKNSRVVGIELSPLTNTVYVNLGVNGAKKKIFKYDIVDNLSLAGAADENTVIRQAFHTDYLVCQKDRNEISILSSVNDLNNKKIIFDKPSLFIGMDSADNVYMAQLNESNEVEKILQGRIDGKLAGKWYEIIPEKPFTPEDIYVTGKGVLYKVMKSVNKVYNIVENTYADYNGIFLQITESHIVSGERGRVLFAEY